MFGHYMFALLYRWVTPVKFISVSNSYSEYLHPQLKFLCVVKGGAEVSLEPAGS